MSLYGWLAPKRANGFGYRSSAEDVTAGLTLSGKTILVTGCSSGLGYETMRVLALRGAQVIGAARSAERATAACAAISDKTIPVACDLGEPSSVRACARLLREGPPLDAIICNAGIMALPSLQQAYGYELQFFTNHIGHFILVTQLLEILADEGRVVMLSSEAHRRAPASGIEFDNLSGEHGYRPFRAYGQSKLANLLFAKELARRLAGTRKTANAVHPGVIHTPLARHVGIGAQLFLAVAAPLFLKSVAEGAATQCYVAVHPLAATLSGAYFADCQIAEPRRDANDPALARRLWDVSSEIVAKLG